MKRDLFLIALTLIAVQSHGLVMASVMVQIRNGAVTYYAMMVKQQIVKVEV